MTADEIIAVLYRVAEEQRERHETAADAGEWRMAVESKFTSLIWRTIALALRLKIVPPGFKPDANPIELARGLRQFCESEIKTVGPTNDRADTFHKIRTIAEVLDGVLYVVGALEVWDSYDAQGAFFLANAAIGLGNAESELGLAEDDHWKEVADLRARQPKRPPGRPLFRADWEMAFEEVAIEKAQGKPVKRADMIRFARAWNDKLKKDNKGVQLPAGDKGIGDGIDRLAKMGVIKLAHRVKIT